MTHHVIRTEEDGTRVYSNYTRYKPKTAEERKYKVRKPDVPGALMYNKMWFLPLEVLPSAARVMPDTRPDDEAYDHMSIKISCRCDVCKRPAAERWRRKWRVDNGLQPGPTVKKSQ